MNNEKLVRILSMVWKAGMDNIGIIAFATTGDKWRANIGVESNHADFGIKIAEHGARLTRREAMAFFPSMNFDLYDE